MFFKEGHHGKLLHKKHHQHQHQHHQHHHHHDKGVPGSGSPAASSGGPGAGDSGVSIRLEVEGEEDVTKEMEKLRTLMAEVNKTLIFIKAVVSTGKTEVLPGSASVILETVMQIFNELRYPLLVQESNSLGSSQSKVCQNLAKFIAWTDDSLVNGRFSSNDNTKRNSSGSTSTTSTSSSSSSNTSTKQQQVLDQEQAKAVIDALLEGLEELTKLGLEKMSQKRSSSFQPSISVQPLASPTLDR
ncbi:hypothetical protein EGW08_006314, partial [Elysia chlorotica]